MAQPQNEPSMPKPADAINIVFGCAATYATCFTPITRCRPGKKAYAIYGPLALLWMFAYAGFARCPILIPYMEVWIVFLIWRRLTSDRTCHSARQGYPWLAARLGFTRSESFALLLEPFFLFWLGVFLYGPNPPLGMFVLGGALSTWIVYATEGVAVEEQRRRMHDARWEMEHQSRIQKGGW